MTNALLNPNIYSSLSYDVQHEIDSLTPEQQSEFEDLYRDKYVNPKLALLASFFGLQYLALHKPLVLLLFWISIFLTIGVTWWTYDIFTIFFRVNKQNNKKASEIVEDIKYHSA